MAEKPARTKLMESSRLSLTPYEPRTSTLATFWAAIAAKIISTGRRPERPSASGAMNEAMQRMPRPMSGLLNSPANRRSTSVAGAGPRSMLTCASFGVSVMG